MSSRRATTARTSSAVKTTLRDFSKQRFSKQFYPSSSIEYAQVSLDPDKLRILLVDLDPNHCRKLSSHLEDMRLVVDTCSDPGSAMCRLRRRGEQYELVIVNVSNSTKSWGRIIQDLRIAASQSLCQYPPFFLCVSTFRQSHQMRLELEEKGARVAYER